MLVVSVCSLRMGKAMKMKTVLTSLALALACATLAEAHAAVSVSALREDGAFAFPQTAANVLCDNSDLRFSVWNNEDYLFAQAVLWNDGDSSPGKTEDNREIGDWSVLMFDLDADGKATPNLD